MEWLKPFTKGDLLFANWHLTNLFYMCIMEDRKEGYDMEVFFEVVKTVGFPIACAVFLAWYLKKQTDEYREDVKSIIAKYEAVVKEITEKYEKAIEKYSKSIDKNTLVLTALDSKLGVKGDAENEGKL